MNQVCLTINLEIPMSGLEKGGGQSGTEIR